MKDVVHSKGTVNTVRRMAGRKEGVILEFDFLWGWNAGVRRPIYLPTLGPYGVRDGYTVSPVGIDEAARSQGRPVTLNLFQGTMARLGA